MEKIIVIDDESLSLLSLRSTLSTAGYTVDAYSDLDQVPSPWPVQRWDCIICDYFLHDRTGLELLKTVRNSGDDSPFIIVTINDDLRAVIDAMQLSATDYLLKPLDATLLRRCVKRNIEIAREHRILMKLQNDQAALEAEKRQIINWRLLYAAKETRQTEMMIRQLSRSINRTGGYSWIDLLSSDTIKLPDGRISLSQEILDIVLNITAEQKRILDYLDFMSKLDTMPFNTQSVPVVEFMAFIQELLKNNVASLALRNQRQIKLSIPKDLPQGTVMLEKQYFQDILWELVCNAIKYSPSASDITIYPLQVQINGHDQLQIVISNEAAPTILTNEKGEKLSGIPYEYSEQIFDMFYSIDPAGHQIEGEQWQDGTGLYIARRLMKRTGGWIKATNGSDLSSTKKRLVVNMTLEFPLTR